MRTLFYTIFLLISITLTGQVNNSEKKYTMGIELDSSIEDTWRLLSDVSMWKQWDSHIIDARLDGDFVDNSKGSLVTANSKVVDFQVVDFIEGKSYTLRHKLSSGTLYLKRAAASTNTGTKVMTEVWYKGLSARNFKNIYGK